MTRSRQAGGDRRFSRGGMIGSDIGPLRRVSAIFPNPTGYWTEILDCGHPHLANAYPLPQQPPKRRRCAMCKGAVPA